MADTVNRRSYGPEAAEVQIAVPADTNQALGTVIQFAQRVRRLFVRNLGLFPVTLEVQQSPVTGGGAAFVTVTGTSTTIVAGGEAPIEFAGLVNDPVVGVDLTKKLRGHFAVGLRDAPRSSKMSVGQ